MLGSIRTSGSLLRHRTDLTRNRFIAAYVECIAVANTWFLCCLPKTELINNIVGDPFSIVVCFGGNVNHKVAHVSRQCLKLNFQAFNGPRVCACSLGFGKVMIAFGCYLALIVTINPLIWTTFVVVVAF